MKFKWESISETISDSVCCATHRAKVHGGWIVKDDVYIMPEGVSNSTIFIPDKDHKWRVDE